jgi:hypothetical protein
MIYEPYKSIVSILTITEVFQFSLRTAKALVCGGVSEGPKVISK